MSSFGKTLNMKIVLGPLVSQNDGPIGVEFDELARGILGKHNPVFDGTGRAGVTGSEATRSCRIHNRGLGRRGIGARYFRGHRSGVGG